MTDWRKVHSSAIEQPSELDTTSSATTVYERKNIQQVTLTDPETEEEYTQWEYDERTYSVNEYKDLTSPTTQLFMQNLSDIEAELLTLALQ